MPKIKLKNLFTRKKKVEKTPVLNKIANSHKFTDKKNIQDINEIFEKQLREAHAENLSSEILDFTSSAQSEKGIDSKKFLSFFKTREGRVLKRTPRYILQYSRSPNYGSIELALTLINGNKPSKHQLKISFLKSFGDNAILNSSVTKKRYAKILEQLGVKTIKAELSLFDPISKIDISIYPEVLATGITQLSGLERQNWSNNLEKKYKKLIKSHPELQNTVIDISRIGSVPLPVYKVVKAFENYRVGEIIVDTRVN